MAQQTINIGASPNDGTGTPLRTAFQYTNSNFSELYTAVGPSGNNIVCPGSATITGDLTVDTSTLKVVSASDVVGINTASPLTGTDAGLTIGAIGTVKALNIGLQNTFARLREKDAIDAFAITTNITASNTQDDATKSSWKARMGFGNGNDNFIISRSGVGSTTFYDLLAVSTGSCVWYDGAGGTRMTLNATGLGVGGAPVNPLTVFAAASAKAPALLLSTAGSPTYGWDFSVDGASTGNLFLRSLVAGTKTDVLEFDRSNGNLGIGVTPAGTGGCLQLKSGITFPATQVASSDANTLDDYEEGTFTPVVRGSTTSGTGTYTTQFGRYTKVGRLVTVSVTLVWTAHTGTGNLQFAGLPFTSASTASAYDGIAIAYQSNISSAANTVLYGLIEFGSTVVTMTATPVGGGAYGLVAMDTAGEIAFTATYTV